MATISARLKESNKHTSPSRLHAGELSRLQSSFFRKNGELIGNLRDAKQAGPKSRNRKRQIQAAVSSIEEYYNGTLLPIEAEMAEQGVFALFRPMEQQVFFGDIIRTSAVCGCPVSFVTNTSVMRCGEGASAINAQPQRSFQMGQYSAFLSAPPRISIFADSVMRALESGMGSSGNLQASGLPASEYAASLLFRKERKKLMDSGFDDAQVLGAFCRMLYHVSIAGEEKDALLDKFTFDVLIHESGHMLLERQFPASSLHESVHEFFAHSASMSVSKVPRRYLAGRIKHASYSLGGKCNSQLEAARALVREFNLQLGIDGFNAQALLRAFPKYLCINPEEVRSISSVLVGKLCSKLGISVPDALGRAAKDAERAVFG